ncbi:MAG: FAD:protein FMN transferase [Phycisphaerales bacterium]
MHTGRTSREAVDALARGRRAGGVRADWPIRLAACAMGTRFELIIADAEPDLGTTDALSAGEAALDIIKEWHRRLSVFDRGSLVSLINREAHERPVRVDHDMMDLLLACRSLHADSSGAFDPSIGALVRRRVLDDARWAWTELCLHSCGFDGVEIDQERMVVSFSRPEMALDFGAIAKGLALDEAVSTLREFGITSALIHGGTSSIVAIGAPPQLSGWRVRLGPIDRAPVAVLRDAALSLSAARGRGERALDPVEHVLDPRTGEPASSDRQAACVGPSAMAADAWSTALLVLGSRPASLPSEYATLLHDTANGWRFEGRGWSFADDQLVREPSSVDGHGRSEPSNPRRVRTWKAPFA